MVKVEFRQGDFCGMTNPDVSACHFLVVDGIPVAGIKILLNREAVINGELTHVPASLCDVQTRDEFQGQGYASMILKETAKHYGVEKIHHDGSYTEHSIHLAKHCIRNDGSDAQVRFKGPFNFVADWNEMLFFA